MVTSTKIGLIFSTPAIEATLLSILGKKAPAVTAACKSELQKQAPGDPTDGRYYEKYFPLATLEAARPKNPTLEVLIAALSKV